MRAVMGSRKGDRLVPCAESRWRDGVADSAAAADTKWPKVRDTRWCGAGTPFIPRAAWDARKKTDKPIIITEGPVKGLVLCQAGALSIALNGVWMGVSDNGEEKYSLRPELLEFQWLGRLVYLCFDADQESNPEVLLALAREAVIRLLTDQPEVTEGTCGYGEGRAWDLSKSGLPAGRKIPDGSGRVRE
jgi:Domain of unknown function (DUF3854)